MQNGRAKRDAARRDAKYKTLVENLFADADVRIDGDRPSDIAVINDGFYQRTLVHGSLGLGEAYVDGWWEADRVDEVMYRFANAGLHRRSLKNLRLLFEVARLQISGIGRASKAFEVGRRHYDLGNDLFKTMLDAKMIYSCGYWNGAVTLEEAQEQKLDLTCRKLGLKPGMRVLDIGCGWGGWARFAAENYGVRVVGVTVSEQQLAYGREYCAGLPVELRLQDYRKVNERYDRIVSIGMFEHVGHRYHRTFMKVAERCLNDDGLVLLHTITGNEPVGSAEIPWITKHIFPNGEIPSLRQVTGSAEGIFVVEAMHHFGSDYEKTLAAWYDRFVANWKSIERSYDHRFYRTWTFYLLMARGFFRARAIHVWQVLLSKNGIPGMVADSLRADAERESYDSR